MYISSHPFFNRKAFQLKYSKTELANSVDDIQHPILREILWKFGMNGGLEISSNADIPVVGISGSGNSENVVKAIRYAKEMKSATFTLCGFDGGKLKQIDAVNCIHIPTKDMQVVEDCHSIIFHMIMQILHRHLHR